MKKRNLIAVGSLLAGLACSAVFATSSRKTNYINVNADAPKVLDHFIAAFDDNEARRQDGITGGRQTNFVLKNLDKTSDVSLRLSSGSAKWKVKNDVFTGSNRLQLGFYSDSGSSSAINASIYNLTSDVDFTAIYNGVSIKDAYNSTSYKYISAMYTQEYIEDVQDIAFFWNGAEAGIITLVYQLEGQTTWSLLTSDKVDGSTRDYFTATSKYGGDKQSSSMLYQAVFAGNYNTAEISVSGDFTTRLRGRNARIGVVYYANPYSAGAAESNYIDFTGIMINRGKSIKHYVRAIDSGLVSSSDASYSTVMKMFGYKATTVHKRTLLEEYDNENHPDDGTYFARFNNLYVAAGNASLGSAPNPKSPYEEPVTENLTLSFTYDRQPHTPDICSILFTDSKDYYYAKVHLVNYWCDDREASYDSAPSEPFYYALVFEFDEPYAYSLASYTAPQVVFHIDEAADGSDFIDDWQAARANGGQDGMCDMLSTSEKVADLRALLKRWDHLPEATRNTLGAQEDVTGYTYAQSIAYFKGVLSGEILTENYSAFATASQESNVSTIVVLIIAATLIAVCGAILLAKKKKQQ